MHRAQRRLGPRTPKGQSCWQMRAHIVLQSPAGTKRATSVNVQLPRLQRHLCTGSISRDIVHVPSELCRRRSGTFTDVARLVPPEKLGAYSARRSTTDVIAFDVDTPNLPTNIAPTIIAWLNIWGIPYGQENSTP